MAKLQDQADSGGSSPHRESSYASPLENPLVPATGIFDKAGVFVIAVPDPLRSITTPNTHFVSFSNKRFPY